MTSPTYFREINGIMALKLWFPNLFCSTSILQMRLQPHYFLKSSLNVY